MDRYLKQVNLDTLYSEVSSSVMEIVLGEKMHYHYGVPSDENDPFDQTIIDLFPYIPENSKVLDCGCGWGGPARLLKTKLNCSVTGVTISKSQYEYIKDFEVIHADLETFIPSEKYDVALFIESYTHVFESFDMLKTFYDNVNSLVIKDFVSDFCDGDPKWSMKVRTKEQFIDEIENSGYIIKEYYEIKDFFQPTIDFWMDNMKKINPNDIRGHLKELYNLCYWYKNYNKKNPNINQCVIYATK